VGEKQQKQDRMDRDRERSAEAHWRAAERATDEPGGPTQKTPGGLEIPVPKRKDVDDALRKIAQPEKKS
jgi:hypothetical protein